MRHLTDQEQIGYIHQTLTDAQRESIDQHLAACPTCRARIQAAKQLQQQVMQSVKHEIRSQTPSSHMQFAQVKPALRRRRWAGFQFHSLQLLSGLGTAAVFTLLVVLLFFVMQQRSVSPFGSSPIGQMSASRIFDQSWEERAPYQPGLITDQQQALDLITSAPIYHLDLSVSDDLRRVNGRQDTRFTNQTGQPLEMLTFHLLPNSSNHSITISRVMINRQSVDWTVIENGRFLQINLPYTAAPSEQLVVNIDFTLRMSGSHRAFSGTLGTFDNILTLAHFHPTLATTSQNGWDLTYPYHDKSNPSENSFYQVRVNAPQSVTILSNGHEVAKQDAQHDGSRRRQTTLAIGPANLFYLAISDRYTNVISETIGETTIRTFARANYLMPVAQTTLAKAADALRTYNEQFGTYPFTKIEIIDVPTSNSVEMTAGYPGIVLLNLTYYQLDAENVAWAIAHELARQWLGQAAGHNYLQAPWLVDGLAAYAERIYVNKTISAKEAAALTQSWQQKWQTVGFDLPIGMAANQFTLDHYTAVMSARTPLVMIMLADELGEAEVAAILRTYTQTHLWHPGSTTAFKQIAETRCNCDLTPFFTQYIDPPQRE